VSGNNASGTMNNTSVSGNASGTNTPKQNKAYVEIVTKINNIRNLTESEYTTMLELIDKLKYKIIDTKTKPYKNLLKNINNINKFIKLPDTITYQTLINYINMISAKLNIKTKITHLTDMLNADNNGNIVEIKKEISLLIDNLLKLMPNNPSLIKLKGGIKNLNKNDINGIIDELKKLAFEYNKK